MKPSHAVTAEAAVLREAEKLMMFMEFTPDLYLHYGKELKWSKLCNMKQTRIIDTLINSRACCSVVLLTYFPTNSGKPRAGIPGVECK